MVLVSPFLSFPGMFDCMLFVLLPSYFAAILFFQLAPVIRVVLVYGLYSGVGVCVCS